MKKIYYTPEMELDKFTVSASIIVCSTANTDFPLSELELQQMDEEEY